MIRIITNFKGKFFSKFYRSWKFIKFPTIKFWKKFNRFILNNWFRVKRYKHSFYNSLIVRKYFISYFNLRNSRKYLKKKKIIRKKFNFRVKNFFFFWIKVI